MVGWARAGWCGPGRQGPEKPEQEKPGQDSLVPGRRAHAPARTGLRRPGRTRAFGSGAVRDHASHHGSGQTGQAQLRPCKRSLPGNDAGTAFSIEVARRSGQARLAGGGGPDGGVGQGSRTLNLSPEP